MTQVIFDTQSIGYEAKPGDTISIHSPTVRGSGGVTIGTAPHKIAVHTTIPETGPMTLWQLIKEAE